MSNINPGGANFTNKAQEAILAAQTMAQDRGQQQIDALHLLYALIVQESSVVLTLMQTMSKSELKTKLKKFLAR